MILLSTLDFTLPLKNPVIIFSIVLFIILFSPILFRKIKVPHIIGLILAGVIVGPYALNLLRRDSSMVLFGTVGLLYIMFLAGLEIDMAEFKRNKSKIFFFGFITFLIPFVAGTLASYYILGFGLLSSLLLSSMFSTHTLVSYPIASKYGVTQNRAVTLTIGGTMITDILALLILAGITGAVKEEVTAAYWVQLVLSTAVFVGIVFLIFPVFTRWFFKRYTDSVSQYIFVLAMVFLAAFLAEAAGLEAIIGAFFSGLVLNKFVPHSSPLMNRIDFVGNALFIPFFLISVGMLVDVSVLFNGWGALKVAGVIITVAILTKYLAALITQKTFKLTNDEGNMIFGLSTSHAAATLAIILVGYNIIIGETSTGEPIRLLNEDVLNGTILLILVSCAVSSFVIERASSKLMLSQDTPDSGDDNGERILISLAYPDTVAELVDFGLLLKPQNSVHEVYALHVTDDGRQEHSVAEKGERVLERAVKHAAATENRLIPVLRYDQNISNGIIYTIKEHRISDILIGLHHKSDRNDFFGPTAGNLLDRVLENIYIYKPVQPFNTLKRLVILAPPNAETEPGFLRWLAKVNLLAKSAGLHILMYASAPTISEVRRAQERLKSKVEFSFVPFERWEDILIISREIRSDDLFVVIASRRGQISYHDYLSRMPDYLSSYFEANSFLIIYPRQLDHGINLLDIEQTQPYVLESIAEGLGNVRTAAKKLGKRIFWDRRSGN